MRSDQRQYLVLGFASTVALSTIYAMYKLNRDKKRQFSSYDDDEGIIVEDNRQIADGLTDLIGGLEQISCALAYID